MGKRRDRAWKRVRGMLKQNREEEEDNGDFWTDRILSMKEIAEGLKLLEKGYNAKVDREAKLPIENSDVEAMYAGIFNANFPSEVGANEVVATQRIADAMKRYKNRLLKEGWRKEVKDADKNNT